MLEHVHIKNTLFISISAAHTELWWRIFFYECGTVASGFPLSLLALSNDPHAGQGWPLEPRCLLACQRNVTASSVQGQTGECSLQLSITPGAGRDTHRELSFLYFIYLFLFHPLHLSCYLNFCLIFAALPPFVFLLSCQSCQHPPAIRKLYTLRYTWIFFNNSSSRWVRSYTLSASIFDLIRCLAEAQLLQRAHICTHTTQPPTHPHAAQT